MFFLFMLKSNCSILYFFFFFLMWTVWEIDTVKLVTFDNSKIKFWPVLLIQKIKNPFKWWGRSSFKLKYDFGLWRILLWNLYNFFFFFCKFHFRFGFGLKFCGSIQVFSYYSLLGISEQWHWFYKHTKERNKGELSSLLPHFFILFIFSTSSSFCPLHWIQIFRCNNKILYFFFFSISVTLFDWR